VRFGKSLLLGATGTVFTALAFLSTSPAQAATPIVSVAQGGIARWSGLAAKECGLFGKRYAAVDAVCYFPIDLRTPPGRHEIALWDQDGKRHVAYAQVEEGIFAEEEIELPPTLQRYVEVSPEDSARAAKETAEVAKILNGKGGPPRFSLPLGKPAEPLPKGDENFGSTRVFNGKVKSFHTGRDYPVTDGKDVKALADGTVVLVADHFFTGNAVYVDHGDGLVSMSFHLKSVAVKAGDEVKRGQTLGQVGSTGRATGPHLHVGARWLGKRVDPALLLEAPTALPGVGEKAAEAKKADPAAKKKPKSGAKPAEDEG
jgi:murein DD-endopeptidase MepM/ murein hydrolase activator NlpD